jgi:hypothetical protein
MYFIVSGVNESADHEKAEFIVEYLGEFESSFASTCGSGAQMENQRLKIS